MKVRLSAKRKARVEMVPLIDTVFLLLVFFIYSMLSMAVHRGLPVQLPASSSAAPEKELVLSVTVKETADGPAVFLDKEPVDLDDLAERLRARVDEEKKGEEAGVLLFADRKTDYQMLFRVLDRINRAGLSRISLQAEAESLPAAR